MPPETPIYKAAINRAGRVTYAVVDRPDNPDPDLLLFTGRETMPVTRSAIAREHDKFRERLLKRHAARCAGTTYRIVPFGTVGGFALERVTNGRRHITTGEYGRQFQDLQAVFDYAIYDGLQRIRKAARD